MTGTTATQARNVKQRTTDQVVADLNALAEAKGGRVVTLEYLGSRHKLELECGYGHRWEAFAHNIFSKKSWCPHCHRNDKAAVFASIQERARSLGGQCLSDAYVSQDTPMSFRCKNGHSFEALTGNVLYKKSWCPLCARNIPAGYDESDLGAVHDLSTAPDIAIPSNGRKKLRWRCEEGHTFSATVDAARQRGCGRCARKEAMVEDGINRLRELAAAHGGRWIESEYEGSLAKYEFECANHHRFTKHIHHAEKHWCGQCKKGRTK
jgi:hypothetical protein